MKRRCAFLDNCPGFNYNSGSSDYVTNDQGKREKNDTTQLGSTLMDTMLKEVGDFCDPFIRENWAMKPHHQVCYMHYSNCQFVSCGTNISHLQCASFNSIQIDTGKVLKLFVMGVSEPFLLTESTFL